MQITRGRSKPDERSDTALCMSQLQLSARVYHCTQTVKLALTIADLAEALQY